MEKTKRMSGLSAHKPTLSVGTSTATAGRLITDTTLDAPVSSGLSRFNGKRKTLSFRILTHPAPQTIVRGFPCQLPHLITHAKADVYVDHALPAFPFRQVIRGPWRCGRRDRRLSAVSSICYVRRLQRTPEDNA